MSVSFNLSAVRAEFPALSEVVRDGKPLVYLDSAATSQKPQAVLDATLHAYSSANANVRRGVHELSRRATEAFEETREKARRFLGAASVREIIFTKGVTEAANLVAHSWGRSNLQAGDEILVTELEHHSNIVPWQLIAAERGAVLRAIPIHDNGELDLDALPRLLSNRVKLVAVGHVSNALGTINPVEKIANAAHGVGAVVFVDGAQATPHLDIDVRKLGADFYAVSSHKMYGPTGVGVLYGREELLEPLPPYQGGGDMIRSVTIERTTYDELPHRFEAGTPNIAGVIAFGAALDFLTRVGSQNIRAHEEELLRYGTRMLSEIEGLKIIGTATNKAPVISFTLEGVHPHDIGSILDADGIAIRTGHHCCMPLMQRLGIPGTARASFGVYNSKEEIDALVHGLGKVRKVFG